ncbi:NAD-dependent malic enzyme [bacterium HR39]|nr:NAD-dependent malic enzyme [bacterium HR39]
MADNMSEDLKSGALVYHRLPKPGKLEIQATKPLGNQRDLALAYSPGVAAACMAIHDDPQEAATLTIRQNLVAVLSNGTAVLGLGDIGPLASKPVMEGKAVLFKKFAGIDVFDIEVDQKDVDKLVDVVCSLEPTFGGINLEDIKAPECFEVEERCRERMNIPVFHDDQHGTAIIVAAAVLNALELAGKQLSDAKIVTSGAGAAALACLNLLVSLGATRENITVTDIKGVVYKGRAELMDRWKDIYAQETEARTLADVIPGADVFIGLSAGGVLKPEYLEKMAEKPLIMALANPYPEIMPDVAEQARPDAMICTGRSDFPNQVNNVLCFPFLCRGARDVGARRITFEMKKACVEALARLARTTTPDTVAMAYGLENLTFGPDYLIPKPFDPRLIVEVPPAVAKAAMDSGVATRPIEDPEAYRRSLEQKVYRSGFLMKPVFERVKAEPQRVCFADGEEERVLRAVQVAVEEGLVRPILIGRPEVVEMRLERYGLWIRPGEHFELVNPNYDPRYDEYVEFYFERMGRRGVTPALAREIVRTRRTVIGAIMVARGEADALVAGPVGVFESHLGHITGVLGLEPGMREACTVHALVLPEGVLFLADTYVAYEPDAAQIAEIALHAAEVVRRFGIVPKVALVSHSNFGSRDTPSSLRMREALAIIRERAPGLEVDGEMHADAALSQEIRDRILPTSTLRGRANLLVMPGLDAANIAFNLAKVATGAVSVGPILVGPAKPAHILTASVTTRGVLNMTAIAALDAILRRAAEARA